MGVEPPIYVMIKWYQKALGSERIESWWGVTGSGASGSGANGSGLNGSGASGSGPNVKESSNVVSLKYASQIYPKDYQTTIFGNLFFWIWCLETWCLNTNIYSLV